jgi:WD40 repeat protein
MDDDVWAEKFRGGAVTLENLHKGPATSVDVNSEVNRAVTVGEDGNINFLQSASAGWRIQDSISKAEGGAINSVCYISPHGVCTAASGGSLKVWDQRSERPLTLSIKAAHGIDLFTVAAHPHQNNLIATGGGDGSLRLWDLRQTGRALHMFKRHSAQVWEVQFHKQHPEYIFSCSEDGQLLMWDLGQQEDSTYADEECRPMALVTEEGSDWMPINSFDINANQNMLGCCTDGGALLLTPNVLPDQFVL